MNTWNEDVAGPFILMKRRENMVDISRRFLIVVSLRFIEEKLRSHSTEETRRSWRRSSNCFNVGPTFLMLLLQWRNSSHAIRGSNQHNLANRRTASSPKNILCKLSFGHVSGFKTAPASNKSLSGKRALMLSTRPCKNCAYLEKIVSLFVTGRCDLHFKHDFICVILSLSQFQTDNPLIDLKTVRDWTATWMCIWTFKNNALRLCKNNDKFQRCSKASRKRAKSDMKD